MSSVPLIGFEPVQTLIDAHRGAIIATVHSPAGYMALLAGSLRTRQIAVVAGDWLWRFVATPGPRRTTVVEASGATLVSATRSFRTLQRMLEEGQFIILVADFPGRFEVPLLGKTAKVNAGLARLSQIVGVPVVPVLGCWDGVQPSVRFGAPLEPVEGEQTAAYMQRVSASIDQLLVDRPEHWMPFTNNLWPDDAGPYLWAYA